MATGAVTAKTLRNSIAFMTISDSDREIPSGLWQRWVGSAFIGVGLFCWLASTPVNGAGDVAAVCFAIGGPLMFWGALLHYLSVIERRIIRLTYAVRPGSSSELGT